MTNDGTAIELRPPVERAIALRPSTEWPSYHIHQARVPLYHVYRPRGPLYHVHRPRGQSCDAYRPMGAIIQQSIDPFCGPTRTSSGRVDNYRDLAYPTHPPYP